MSNIVPITDTEVVVGQPARQPANAALTLEQKWWLAQKVAGTEFVPKAFRNRPEAAFAAMLYGAERGFSEMASLNNIHVIEGRPQLSAEAMRALVLAHGHTIEILESNAQRCTVIGRRAGSETTSPPFTWTLDRARRARLSSKPNWQMHPEQMLLARASAELCRALFADVVAGLDVIEEQDELEESATTTTRRPPSRTRRLSPAPTAPPATTPPATPRSPTADDVDLGGIPGADEPSWAPGTPADTAAESKKAATAFARRLNAELSKAFPDADRAQRDRYRHALVACITRSRDQGPVTSSSELTEAEQMATAKAMLNIAAGTATITDGPDGTVELRGKDSYSVTFDPLTVTTIAPIDVDEHQADDEQPTVDNDDEAS